MGLVRRVAARVTEDPARFCADCAAMPHSQAARVPEDLSVPRRADAAPRVGEDAAPERRVGQGKTQVWQGRAGGKAQGKPVGFLWIGWGWVGKGERCGGFGGGWNYFVG